MLHFATFCYSSRVFAQARIMKVVSLTLLALVGAFLTGCAADAPPCNDPGITKTAVELVQQIYDKNLPRSVKSKDVAEMKLGLPRVVAYDEKLKIRKCSAELTVQVPDSTVVAMNHYVKAVDRVANSDLAALRELMNLLGGKIEKPQFSDAERAEVEQWIALSGGSTADKPISKTLEYTIQKQEGSSDWIVAAQVDYLETVQYLRIADRANKLFRERMNTAASETPPTQAPAPVAVAAPTPVAVPAPVQPSTPQVAPAAQPQAPVASVEPFPPAPAAPPAPPPAAAPAIPQVSAEIKPSFDCAKASTVIEHLICKDAGLAKLDVELGSAYRSAVQATPDKGSLRAEQNEWLKTKRNKCNTPECLRDAYTVRIAELKQ